MTSFSPFGKSFDAFLFDMDGTILSSIEATERVWSEWAIRHGIDPVTFLPTIHGVRAVETVRRLALPGVDPIREAEILLQAEMADLDGIAPIDGAYDFLSSLPQDRWAIVTSAPLELATRRVAAALNVSSLAQNGLASIHAIALCSRMRQPVSLQEKLPVRALSW